MGLTFETFYPSEVLLDPQLPWLVLGEDRTTKKRDFFNLCEQKHYSIDIPQLYGQYICGSSYGWLFTRVRYELPTLPLYAAGYNTAPVYDSDGSETTLTIDEMQKAIISKAVLSHDPMEKSDFIAMIIYGEYKQLAIWKPGDMVWTIENGLDEPLADIIFHQGKIYAISRTDTLISIDVGSESSDLNFTRVISPSAIAGYLLDFNGDLYLARRIKHEEMEPTERFFVYWNDLEKLECRELHDMNGFAVFVGNNSAVIVDSSKCSGCVKNGIYFTDLTEHISWEAWGHDFGVYDMVDKTVKEFCESDLEIFHPEEAALTWLTPSR